MTGKLLDGERASLKIDGKQKPTIEFIRSIPSTRRKGKRKRNRRRNK